MKEIYNPENYIKSNGTIFLVPAVTAGGCVSKETREEKLRASFKEMLEAKDPNAAKKLAALVSGVVGATEDQSKFKGEEKQ